MPLHLVLSVVVVLAMPQEQSAPVVVAGKDSRSTAPGAAEFFTGRVTVHPMFEAKEPSRANGASVTFEPGARTAWHTHPLGQTLIVTAGTGRVQRWGDTVQEIRTGDVVWIPANQKHWHGASPLASMTHTAIHEHLEGKVVEWMEHVTDEQYRAAPSNEVRPPQEHDFGSVSPALERYRNEILESDLWQRPGLTARDRSMVTVAALIARDQQTDMREQFALALDNGVTPAELSEVITHLAFYAGWPNASSAVQVARQIFSARNVSRGDLPAASPSLLPLNETAEKERAAGVQANFGLVSPGVVQYTTDVLFRDLWLRPGLAPRDRSLVTISALIASGNVEQVPYHLNRAMDSGLTGSQTSEVLTHLAFYAGWPSVFSALPVVKGIFEERAKNAGFLIASTPNPAAADQVKTANGVIEGTGPSTAENSAQAVRDAHERRRTATVDGDAAAVESMMTDDLTFTHPDASVETKAQFIDALRTGRYDYKTITDEEQQVRVYGDSGVVTGICRIVINVSGTDVDVRVRFVELWVRQASVWRMALWHATEVR